MRNPTDFFIADTHFGHTNVIKYAGRPYDGVEEMNEDLIKRWNKAVGKADRVFMCGDFALGSKTMIIEIGNRLHGRKTLILGNHDGASMRTYYEAGFEFISRQPILYDEKFIVSHEPRSSLPMRNIFGHIHEKPIERPIDFCVSVEKINYTPISYEEILSKIGDGCGIR